MSTLRVRCEPLGIEVEAQPGESVFEALRRAGVPVGSACHGEGICGRCGLELVSGELSPPEALELRVAKRNGLAPRVRLSCCAVPVGPVVVRAPYW